MEFEIISLLKTVDIFGMITGSLMAYNGDPYGWVLLIMFAIAFYCFDLGDRYHAAENKENKR